MEASKAPASAATDAGDRSIFDPTISKDPANRLPMIRAGKLKDLMSVLALDGQTLADLWENEGDEYYHWRMASKVKAASGASSLTKEQRAKQRRMTISKPDAATAKEKPSRQPIGPKCDTGPGFNSGAAAAEVQQNGSTRPVTDHGTKKSAAKETGKPAATDEIKKPATDEVLRPLMKTATKKITITKNATKRITIDMNDEIKKPVDPPAQEARLPTGCVPSTGTDGDAPLTSGPDTTGKKGEIPADNDDLDMWDIVVVSEERSCDDWVVVGDSDF